ncbi:MAG: T9SS type A sorting domain-containing protein, partial [Bacteroidota bacterium]
MKHYSLLFLLFFAGKLAFGQMVTTVTQGSFTDAINQDAQGNVYCSDFTSTTVYKYDIDGNVSSFVSGLTSPNGIGINDQDEIFICEHYANRITKFDLNGNQLEQFTGFNRPAGVKHIPGTDAMLVVEYQGNRIFRLNADGSREQLHSGTPMNGPAGIAFIGPDAYIANYNNRRIYRLDINQTLTFVAQIPAGGPTNNVLGFLDAKDGLLIATQLGNHKLYTINPDNGMVQVFAGSSAGSADGLLSDAQFNGPNGIYADQTNNRIYISEYASKNLRIIEGLVLSDGLQASIIEELSLFPNPVKDTLTIKAKLEQAGELNLRLYDQQGKLVKQAHGQSLGIEFRHSMQLDALPSGIYFLELNDGRQSISR